MCVKTLFTVVVSYHKRAAAVACTVVTASHYLVNIAASGAEGDDRRGAPRAPRAREPRRGVRRAAARVDQYGLTFSLDRTTQGSLSNTLSLDLAACKTLGIPGKLVLEEFGQSTRPCQP